MAALSAPPASNIASQYLLDQGPALEFRACDDTEHYRGGTGNYQQYENVVETAGYPYDLPPFSCRGNAFNDSGHP